MKLGDVYRHKENNSIIQIDSFATRMGKLEKEILLSFLDKLKNTMNLKLVVVQVLMDMAHNRK